jgi:hypothetical protein
VAFGAFNVPKPALILLGALGGRLHQSIYFDDGDIVAIA